MNARTFEILFIPVFMACGVAGVLGLKALIEHVEVQFKDLGGRIYSVPASRQPDHAECVLRFPCVDDGRCGEPTLVCP